MADKKSNVTIYLPEAVLEELRRLADAEGRSLSNYLSQFLGRHALEKANVKSFLADSHQMDITEQIARQVQRGPVRTVSNNTNRQTHGDLRRAAAKHK